MTIPAWVAPVLLLLALIWIANGWAPRRFR